MSSIGKVCLIFLLCTTVVPVLGKLTEFVKWQSINYKNLPGDADFNSYVNVPFGVAHYGNKLFVGVPRRNPGIPSTLNVVELTGAPPYINPPLISYPNLSMNTLSQGNRPDAAKIVSVYRPRVDKCNRLWFVDTGVLEYPNNQIVVQPPSIWAIDLKTDSPLGRFEIPRTIVENGRGLAAITIDDEDCTDAYAYLPDWMNNALLVFSARQAKMWRFNHNYFYFNPFEGDFNVDGLQFQWNDGIFSIALSKKKPNGFRTAFFHPLGSHSEFTTSTEVLKNEAFAGRRTHGTDFKFIGHRGHNSQAGIHAIDPMTNVVFFAEMQNNAVSCWNMKRDLKRNHMDIVAQNNATLIYPVDLIIDNDATLWVLSNRLPRFLYDRLDANAYNFNIWRENVNDALSDTSCLKLKK